MPLAPESVSCFFSSINGKRAVVPSLFFFQAREENLRGKLGTQKMQPNSYGVVALGLQNQEPLLHALLQRASFREDPALAQERVRSGPHELAAPLGYARGSFFNVLLSDRLCFDAGFGVETVFTCLRGPAGADVPQGHPATPPGEQTFPPKLVVAQWQIVNHLPNSFSLVNKAGLIRSLYRRFKTSQQGAASSPHVFECVPPIGKRFSCSPPLTYCFSS